MALDNDLQKPVAALSDRQEVSASNTDGTLPTSAEIRQLDPPRRRSPRRRGPKTAAGKARVSLNAITFGIFSVRPVVPGESSREWESHRHAIVGSLAPASPLEMVLAERVALLAWRLQRVTAYEVAAIAERQDSSTISARLLPHPLDIDKIVRLEAHLSRQFFLALHELESRQAARSGQRASLIRLDIHGAPEAVANHCGGDRVSSPNTGDAVIEGHLSTTPSHLPT
jgi:hypothetical protein